MVKSAAHDRAIHPVLRGCVSHGVERVFSGRAAEVYTVPAAPQAPGKREAPEHVARPSAGPGQRQRPLGICQ